MARGTFEWKIEEVVIRIAGGKTTRSAVTDEGRVDFPERPKHPSRASRETPRTAFRQACCAV